MNKRLYELTDGSEVMATKEMDASEFRNAQEIADSASDGTFHWTEVRPVNICQCDRCHAIFNGLIGSFVCPECGDDSPTTDLSLSDVFTPWAGASDAENDATAEEMYEALRNGKTF